MGILCITFSFNLNFNFADIISILGIIANIWLALRIVSTIQNKQVNQRTLKDHFIDEIKEVRKDYMSYIREMHAGSLIPKDALPWFKTMNIKVTDLMENLEQKYGVSSDFLEPFQIELREILTNSNEYIINYQSNTPFKLRDLTVRKVSNFQRSNSSKFTELIITINDCEK